MGRHNRDAEGADQRGYSYSVSYPPDWLSHIKVTRLLETGRQSTMTLLRNPEAPRKPPGKQVRTRIRSPEQGLDVEVVLRDPRETVSRVTIETAPDDVSSSDDGSVTFTLHGHGSTDGDED